MAEIIDHFASMYGWSIYQILDLTMEEVSLLSDASAKRFKIMYGETSKSGKIDSNERKKVHKLDESFDFLAKIGKAQEVS